MQGAQGYEVGVQDGCAFLVAIALTFSSFPAASKRDCLERFGPRTLDRITQDDDVICTTEYSRIVPLENGEVGVHSCACLGVVGPCH